VAAGAGATPATIARFPTHRARGARRRTGGGRWQAPVAPCGSARRLTSSGLRSSTTNTGRPASHRTRSSCIRSLASPACSTRPFRSLIASFLVRLCEQMFANHLQARKHTLTAASHWDAAASTGEGGRTGFATINPSRLFTNEEAPPRDCARGGANASTSRSPTPAKSDGRGEVMRAAESTRALGAEPSR
jgi:hypothetical protein